MTMDATTNLGINHLQVIVRAMQEVAQLDGVHDAESVQPVARFPAGVAGGEAVEGGVGRAHGFVLDGRIPRQCPLRSSSLIEVLLRVLASTCLTITAAYSEYLPSAEGSWPETTTLPAGTRP